MKILTRIANAFRRQAPTISAKSWMDSIQSLLTRRVSSDGKVSNPYSESWVVRAASQRKAEMTASVPLVVMVGSFKAKEGEQAGGDHPVARLMDNPSPMFSTFDMIQGTSISLDLYGEAFWVGIDKAGGPFKPGQLPAELVLVDPRYMTEEIDPKTKLLLGWKLNTGSAMTWLTASQVGQVKHYNPDNPYRGASPLSPVRSSMDYDLRASMYNASLLANGADPGGIISSDAPLSKEEADELRAKWEDRHKGAMKAQRVAILSGGLKYETVGVPPKDMAFGESLDRAKMSILAVLGMTRFDIGQVEATNRASAYVAQEQTWRNTILPQQERIAFMLWRWLLAPLSVRMGSDVWVEFDTTNVEPLKGPISERATTAATLIQAGYTAESVNELLGLGLEVATDTAPPDPVVPDPTPPTPQPVPQPDPPQDMPPAKAATQAARSKDFVEVSGKRFRVVKRGWKPDSREDAKTRKLISGKLKALFREIREEELAAVGTFATAINAAIAVSNPPEKAVERLQPQGIPFDLPSSFKRWLKEAPYRWQQKARERLKDLPPDLADSAIRSVERQMGGFSVVKIDDPEWLREATSRTASMIRVTRGAAERFNETILRHVGKEGLASVSDLAKQVEKTMGSYIVSDSMTIARTETGFLQESFKVRAAKKEGYTHHEWVNAFDARETHKGQGTVRIGDKFPNGLYHPCQIGAPASEVINCRCTAVPLILASELGTDADLAELARLTAGERP